MKHIVLALPGAADQPAEELGEKTPFEVAKIPNLNYLTKIGKLGSVNLVPRKVELSADATFLNLLGYEADKVFTGRGPLEAANLELELEDNEIPFRMNFITEAAGSLADPTAGKLSTKEARALINFLNKRIASDFVRFYPGSGHKHIAVLKDAHGYEALSARTNAPEYLTGEPLEGFFPKGPGEELIKKLMYDARLLLQDHEINQVRVDLQENPANMIWLWGQGKKPALASFAEMTGLSAAFVGAAEYARGISRLAGMDAVPVAGATGDTETDYLAKGEAMGEALKEHDFVCVHVGAGDEAARKGDLKAKISALEGVDYYIVSKIREVLENQKEVRVLVTPCHSSPWSVKRHTRDAVPFVIAGKNIMADDIEKISELTAKTSELKLEKNTELMSYFLAR